MKKVCVIHGPNLNFTGIREKTVYGTKSLDDFNKTILEKCVELGFEAEIFQSNYEGAIIDKLQECYFKGTDGIVINPAAYTHTSVAILDALKAVSIPTVEVHLSDINSREEFRKHSYVSMVAVKTICGLGFDGYAQAVKFLKTYLEK